MTPKRFQDTEGNDFSFTVLDDRAGRETRPGFYQKLDEGEPAGRLPPEVFGQVRAQAEEGERLMGSGDLNAAFRAFLAALNRLPAPWPQWNAAGWLLMALGECSFRHGNWKSAAGPLQDAIFCPGGLGNPWLHLRLGQVRFELGEEPRAIDELARAYMGGGREVFEGEDPKYFALVERVLEPPPGRDRLP